MLVCPASLHSARCVGELRGVWRGSDTTCTGSPGANAGAGPANPAGSHSIVLVTDQHGLPGELRYAVMNCQNARVVVGPTNGVANPAGNAPCNLNCTSQQLVCKQACTRPQP